MHCFIQILKDQLPIDVVSIDIAYRNNQGAHSHLKSKFLSLIFRNVGYHTVHPTAKNHLKMIALSHKSLLRSSFSIHHLTILLNQRIQLLFKLHGIPLLLFNLQLLSLNLIILSNSSS
jgi:hypothetical protein